VTVTLTLTLNDDGNETGMRRKTQKKINCPTPIRSGRYPELAPVTKQSQPQTAVGVGGCGGQNQEMAACRCRFELTTHQFTPDAAETREPEREAKQGLDNLKPWQATEKTVELGCRSAGTTGTATDCQAGGKLEYESTPHSGRSMLSTPALRRLTCVWQPQ
jgi:hypothetical protein